MCIENTLIDISHESSLSKAKKLSLRLIARDVKKLKKQITQLKAKMAGMRTALNLYRQDEPSAEQENEKHRKPCPYDKSVQCVQGPEDSCGCDPCEECETKLKANRQISKP